MTAIAITRTDMTAVELRAAAGREQDRCAARRMLALAMVFEGVHRAAGVTAHCPAHAKPAYISSRRSSGVSTNISALKPAVPISPSNFSLSSGSFWSLSAITFLNASVSLFTSNVILSTSPSARSARST